MVQRTEQAELLAAWRALSGNPCMEGWRTIPVAITSPCRILAGRHFPGNEEALLIGFVDAKLPPVNRLPQGRGFQVSKENMSGQDRCVWVALRRQNAGRLDLFAMMAVDILAALDQLRGVPDERRVDAFLSRITAWQEFMRRGSDGVLSPDAEVGLVGELAFLGDLLAIGLPSSLAIEAWQGPLDGIHDFEFGAGAIEVKTTLAAAGFPAIINSLDQLDDSFKSPLFLAGIRLALDPAGASLPAFVASLREMLLGHPGAVAALNTRLLHAGYFEDVAESYVRRFSRVGSRLMSVSDAFPRLTHANVPLEVRKARYELDLDLIAGTSPELYAVLVQLGIME